jgi:hypothetical protein
MELEGLLPCSQEHNTDPFLSQINPVHTLITYSFKLHFNIILLYMPSQVLPGSFRWFSD